MRRTIGLGSKTRKFFSLILGMRLGVGGIDTRAKAILSAHAYSWARYATDGTCVQLFDADAKRVTKVALCPDTAAFHREVALRSQMAGSCPAILEWDGAHGTIVEPMLELRPCGFSPRYLDQAIALLEKRLYRKQQVAVDDYLDQLLADQDSEKIRLAVAKCNIGTVEISNVHGDLWSGNLCIDEKGTLLILDWEYARRCAVTHDVWTYLFQRQRASRASFDEVFMEAFAAAAVRCLKLKYDRATARGYHLIHLLERRTFFSGLVLSHKLEEITNLDREIRDALESIR